MSCHVAWFPLVSVFWGSGVVSGIRGKQMTPLLLKEAFLLFFSENHDYKSFSRVAVNAYVPIFRSLDARGGRKLRTDTQTHTHTHTGQLQYSPLHRHRPPTSMHALISLARGDITIYTAHAGIC